MKKAKSKKSIQKPPAKRISFLNKFFTDTELKVLSAIAAAGFILRLIFINEISDSPFIRSLASDAQIYFEWGKNIARGSWFGHQVFYMSPVYAYFLAVINLIFFDAVFAAQVIQALLNTINIFMIYILARRIFSVPAGYISAASAAVYSIFIFYSGLILMEILHTFFISVFLLLLLRMKDALNNKLFFGTGLIFGILVLFRGNILLFLPVLFIWLYLIYKDQVKLLIKTSVLFLIGVLIPVSLIALNNYIAEEDFLLLTSNGGINFYIGNNPSATGIYMTPKEFSLDTDITGKNYAEKMSGRTLKPGEVSDFWFGEGMEYVKENPSDAVRLFFTKFLLFFDEAENPQSASMDIQFFSTYYSKLMKFPFPGFYFFLLFAAAGTFLNRDKRKNFNILLLFLLTYAAASAIFFVIGRFRVPVAPVIIIFAGGGIYSLYTVIKGKKYFELLKPAAVIILLIIINIAVVPSFSFSNYDALNHVGKTHFEQGNYDQAIENYRKSLQLNDRYSTYLLLGNAYAAKKDFRNARTAFMEALKRNPRAELAYFSLGGLEIQMNKPAEALKNYEKAIELNPSFGEAYKNAAILYYMAEDYKPALDYFQKYLSYTDNENEKITVQRDIEELKKRLKE
jgi:tetratricopeptide (TPR) repeat protein